MDLNLNSEIHEDYIQTRSFLIQNSENILEYLNAKREDNKNESDDLFDFGDENIIFKGRVNWNFDIKIYSKLEILQQERNSLGIYVSGNPLQKYEGFLEWLKGWVSEENIHLVLVEKVRKIFTRNNSMMITISATTAQSRLLEAIIFPKNAIKLSSKLQEKQMFWVYGKINQKKLNKNVNSEPNEYDEEPKLIIENLISFEEGILPILKGLNIDLSINRQEKIENLNWQKIKDDPQEFKKFLTLESDISTKDQYNSNKSMEIRLKKNLNLAKVDLIKNNLSKEILPNGQLVEVWVETKNGFKKVKGDRFWLDRTFLSLIKKDLE